MKTLNQCGYKVLVLFALCFFLPNIVEACMYGRGPDAKALERHDVVFSGEPTHIFSND